MERRGHLSRFDFLLRTEFKFSFTMIMLAIALALFIKDTTEVRKWCFTAVLFSVMGDIMLMDYKNIPSRICSGKHFYVGIFFFGISHIFYHITFSSIISKDHILTILNTGSYIVLMIFIIVVPTIAFLLIDKSIFFKYSVVSYTICILFSMFAIFTCMFELGGRYILAGIGIVLFIASDVFILIRENFKDTELIRKLIWIFYPIAQLMIIFSI